jgi:hypothetical protein
MTQHRIKDMRQTAEGSAEFDRLVKRFKDPVLVERSLYVMFKDLHPKSPDDALRSAIAVISMYLKANDKEAIAGLLIAIAHHFIAQGDGVVLFEPVKKFDD